MSLPADYQAVIDKISQKLPATLGENLYSCILYGSTVRGHVVPDLSDINILIVLNQSTPDAHMAIADSIDSDNDIRVEPFIIARKGMERSFNVFAIKFRSIKRNYKVLYGNDPIQGFSVSDERVRFLAEQALRNLRLRSVNAFVHQRQNTFSYTRFLLNNYPVIFTYVSEILRLDHIEIPRDFQQRIETIGNYFKTDASVLTTLINLQDNPKSIRNSDTPAIHQQLFSFLNAIIDWMEDHW